MDIKDQYVRGKATNNENENENNQVDTEKQKRNIIRPNESKNKMSFRNDRDITTAKYELNSGGRRRSEQFKNKLSKEFNHKGVHSTVKNDHPNMKHIKHMTVFSEDLRISKLLRRLLVEDNANNAIELCKKLEAAVRNQSNATYICRSFDYLFDTMISVLKQCPVECLQMASSILGVMAYINRIDYAVYKMHLTRAYLNHQNIRKYLMWALRKTISCDAVNLNLMVYSERLLNLLKEYLENCDVADNFIAVGETIVEFSKHYKHAFEQHFTDIVDIIIGWLLESEQPPLFKRHCAKILQEFSPFFLKELEFSYNLLGQFVEDINACNEEIASPEIATNVKQDAENRAGAFIGAFTSIIKALSFKDHCIALHEKTEGILNNAIETVRKAAQLSLSGRVVVSEQTVINLNELLCLFLLNRNLELSAVVNIEEFIQLQLTYFSRFNMAQQCSVLYLVLCTVTQFKTKLPQTIVDLIMNTEDTNPLQQLKVNCMSNTYKLLLKIYHEVLKIKNVPLLLQAYHYILNDMNRIIENLDKAQIMTNMTAIWETLLNFYLNALTALAIQTSSIIGMYALSPSILELLIHNCRATSHEFWLRYPALYETLLQLLNVHCSKNHNFRQTSRLLTQQPDLSSPTSDNFCIILKFLSALLKWYEKSTLLVDWLAQILNDCQSQSDILITHNDFLDICDRIIVNASDQPKLYGNLLIILLNYAKLPRAVLIGVRDTALCLIDCIDKDISRLYCTVLSKLPLPICTHLHKGDYQPLARHKQKIYTLCQTQKGNATLCHLRAKFFKPFIESLDSDNTNICLYEAYFEKCCTTNQNREQFIEFVHLLGKHWSLLAYYVQYENAKYCVQQRLRTALGKPQETFLAFEALIMQYARKLAQRENPDRLSLGRAVDMQQKCCMLLGFLENLEKHIYNAASGTAYAMEPAEKQAKTFFRINNSTCTDWFKRVHTSITLIALHCLQPELIIRRSDVMALDTISSNLTVMDRMVTPLVRALLNCGEADTIRGLNVWLKNKSNNRYDWVHYVAEQAAGHLEVAITGYVNVLKTNDTAMDLGVKEFLHNQLNECLYNTARWREIPVLSKEYNSYTKGHLELMESIYLNNVDNEGARVLALTEWPSSELDNYSFDNILTKLKDCCIHKAVTIHHKEDERSNNELMISDVQTVIRDVMCGAIVNGCEPAKYNAQFMDLLALNKVCESLLSNSDEPNNEQNFAFGFTPTHVASKQLMWSLILSQRSSHNNNTNNTASLFLETAATARLEGNALYCQSLLTRFFALKGYDLNLTKIAEQIRKSDLKIDLNDTDILRGFNELSKCLYVHTDSLVDAMELEAACCNQVIEQKSEHLPLHISKECCEMFITMADWLLGQRASNCSAVKEVQFQKLIQQLPDVKVCRNIANLTTQASQQFLPCNEYIIGKLLQASIFMKDDYGQAWFLFGNWCYRWGKKLMENRTVRVEESAVKHNKLTERDIDLIANVLNDDFSAETIQDIIKCVHSHLLTNLHDEGSVEEIYNDCGSGMDILNNEINKIADLTEEQLQTIAFVWRKAHKGVYGLYEEATRAYFKYLYIQSAQSAVEESALVTITLRILRLIVKHAAGLQEVLEEGLSNTPLLPWRVIVPQLFSRLNHHEPYVRRSVSELLCRLSKDQPQLIIFPAVVGARQELNHHATNPEALFNCFNTLRNKLVEQAGDTVRHVELLVKELRRIAFLWEEYCIYSLGQFYAEYSPLYNSLESVIRKEPYDCALPKCEIFMKHLAKDFESIVLVTQKDAETNYEKMFQERFKGSINAVLKELTKPLDTTLPRTCWLKIKQLYTLLQQRPVRGSASTMKVADLSPTLAKIQNSNITMPGVDAAVHIKSVDALLYILPTKTKPKKMAFYGSDGQRYTFLFKGQEDLHLDERIMQFLSISNTMMTQSHFDYWSKNDDFKAQHYSVIPLGSRSGFISWVDGVTPLFSIYKKWQQRDALLKLQQSERQQGVSTTGQQTPTTANAPRPSDMFYEKLQPLLAEHNLKITDPRKQWPLPVLKSVLRRLTKETPPDLLSKEIWCHANNAADWHKSIRRYTISVAVMSIIGYVIGLGDRHLDNILIKLRTGEIVHIDYNVCFEKGRTLRVPEKVPCRLTPNILNAFGLTGIEGTFRLGCEYVLKTLRKERETLLTLLEAFVYDPLVDWTVSNDGLATTSRLTTAHVAAMSITALKSSTTNTTTAQLSTKIVLQKHKEDFGFLRQIITGRCKEIKPAWLKFSNNLQEEITNISNHLGVCQENQKQQKLLEQEYDKLIGQQSMVIKLQNDGSYSECQSQATISERQEDCHKLRDNLGETVHDFETMSTVRFDDVLNLEKIRNLLQDPHLTKHYTMDSVRQAMDDMTDNSVEEQFVNKMEASLNKWQNALSDCQETANECLNILLLYTHFQEFCSRLHIQDHGKTKQNTSSTNIMEKKEPSAKADATDSECKRVYFEKLITVYEYLHSKMLLFQEYKTNQQEHCTTTIGNVRQQHANIIIKASTAAKREDMMKKLLSKHFPRTIDSLLAPLNNWPKSSSTLMLEFHLNSMEIVEEFLKISYEPFYHSDNCEPFCLLLASLKSARTFYEQLNYLPERIFFQFITQNEIHEDINDISDITDIVNMLCTRNGSLMDKLSGCVKEFIDNIKALQENLLKRNCTKGECDDEIMTICKMDVEQFVTHLYNGVIRELSILLKSYAKHMTTSCKDPTDLLVYDVRCVHDIIFTIIEGIENNFMITLTKMSITAIYADADVVDAEEESSIDSDSTYEKLYESLEEIFKSHYNEKSVEYHSKRLEHQKLIISSYFWHNEQLLKDLMPNYCDIPTKSQLKQFLEKLREKLMTCKTNILEIYAEPETKELEYALRSNAPYLESIQSSYTFFIDILTRLLTHCSIVLQFGSLAEGETYSEAVPLYENAQRDLHKGEITPTEMALVQLLDPGNDPNQLWLEKLQNLLNDMMCTTQKKIVELENDQKVAQQALNSEGQQVECLLHALVGLELRNLLKMLTKYYKQKKLDNEASTNDIRNLQLAIKALQSNLNDLHFSLMATEFDVQLIKKKLNEIDVSMQECNDKLMLVIEPFMDQPQRHDSSGNSPASSSPNHRLEKVAVNHQITEQKRNAYAVSVWKRIRMKLEGRDPDPNRRSSVTEQVDWVIREAISENNLASLYEGWTPWV